MAERKPPSWDDIRDLIAQADEACRESERQRNRADSTMRRRPVWPDHRRPWPSDDGDVGGEPT